MSRRSTDLAADYSSTHGLVLFPAASSSGQRRRRLTFLAIHLAVSAGLVWPSPPGLLGPAPVLGLPGPMTWSIGLLAVEFAALLWLYRSEKSARREA